MNLKSAIILLFSVLISYSALDAVKYEKNPYRAMLYSTVVPGGGQIYTHGYIKAVVVMGMQGYLINQAISDYNKMDKYHSLMDGSNSSIDLYNHQQRNNYRNDLRSDYWWIGTTMFLSIADAFVDAHLYNFKAEKSKVHLRFEDRILQLEYSF